MWPLHSPHALVQNLPSPQSWPYITPAPTATQFALLIAELHGSPLLRASSFQPGTFNLSTYTLFGLCLLSLGWFSSLLVSSHARVRRLSAANSQLIILFNPNNTAKCFSVSADFSSVDPAKLQTHIFADLDIDLSVWKYLRWTSDQISGQ